MIENKSRSIGKSISWRILASCDTILISYLITGSIAIAASIGSIEVLTKMFLYYFHERLWDRISFGRNWQGKETIKYISGLNLKN